jgi:hypothetical protein
LNKYNYIYRDIKIRRKIVIPDGALQLKEIMLEHVSSNIEFFFALIMKMPVL